MIGLVGLVGKIFGSTGAFDKSIGLIDKVIDTSFYTEQEKAEARGKATQQKLDFTAEWMKNTQSQNIARRVLAFGVFSLWALFQIASVATSIYGVFIADEAVGMVGRIMQKQAEGMSGAVMLVLGFYFAAPYMGSLVHGALQKFSTVSSAQATGAAPQRETPVKISDR